MELLQVVLKMIFKKSLRFYKFMQKKLILLMLSFIGFLKLLTCTSGYVIF